MRIRSSIILLLLLPIVGSAQLLGQVLNKQLGYEMQLLIADNDDQAVTMLQAGQVQAIFTLGGWPLPSVRRAAEVSLT